jgi:acyl carrier protein
MSDLHLELKQLIVTTLELDDVKPEEIDSEAPLFSAPGAETTGIGLDSIDALELAMAISKTYGITLKGDDEASREILRSVASLAAHIQQMKRPS